MKHIDVTILNGEKHMKNNGKSFRPRRNPDGGEFGREIGKTVLTTFLGATVVIAGAYGASKLPFGAPVAGATAEQNAATARNGALAKNAVIGLGALALGAGLHVNGMAPRVGKAVAAGGVTLAGASLAMTYGVDRRLDALYQQNAQAPAPAPAPATLPPGAPAPTTAGIYDGWQTWNRAVG